MYANISIMIATHNRLEDLKRTCAVVQQLTPPPQEILITADGCTDGTIDFIRSQLPAARLFVNAPGHGSIASRDQMLRCAVNPLVLSLDDDSYPEQTDCLARLERLFAERPQLAVAHFPQRSDEYPATLTKTDFGVACLTRSYHDSGACYRRSLYLQLPGFEPYFFHAYEEPDYTLQCTAAGFEVYFTPAVTIRHHFSIQGRNEVRVHHQHCRNELWSFILRCPFPLVLAMIGWKLLSHLRTAFRRGPDWVVREPVWWYRALKGLPYAWRKRHPVSTASYRRWLQLKDKLYLDAMADKSFSWKARAQMRKQMLSK
jgi:GT2 family glycosyltransferase